MEYTSGLVKEKLNLLFNAQSVALVGASNDQTKWGFIVLNNLISGGFQGRIYPVNPGEDKILRLKVYKSIADIPETPDLVVIVVPAPGVRSVVEECISKGIRAGIIITAGFAELGEKGGQLQQEIVDIARNGGMILVGPNCNGIMNPWRKFYVEFPVFYTPPGHIAVIAQSGNVADFVAHQAMLRGFGCSLCVASGNEADLHSEDYLEYLAEDAHTKVILSYIEGLRDGRRFFQIAREVSRKKPIVILKAGKTAAGARAAKSHTASIAGSDNVFDAVCKQSGVIRAKSLDEMVNIGIAFLRQPLPRGRRVGIVTAGGGWGVIAADACVEQGLELVSLPNEIINKLDTLLPPWWNRGNPVDLVAGSSPDAIFKAIEVLLSYPSVDAVMMLSIMPVLGMKRLSAFVDETTKENWGNEMVQAVVNAMEHFNRLADNHQKPVIVASEHMFADAIQETRISYNLGQHSTVCYHMPHQAAAALAGLASYGEYLRRDETI